MKFVHLASRKAVDRILRHGLRLGDGRQGRGLYAVPLFRLPRLSDKDPERWEWGAALSEPVSSGTLWRQIFSAARPRGDRPISVVFEAPEHLWPATLVLEMQPDSAEGFLDELRGEREGGFVMAAQQESFVRQAARSHCFADLKLEVSGPAAVGTVLHHYLAAGGYAWSRWDETVEIVFPRPVPPRFIERLAPLSQTNVGWKRRREKAKAPMDQGE